MTHLTPTRDLSGLSGCGTLLYHFKELQVTKQSGKDSLRPGYLVIRSKVNRIDFLDRPNGSLFILMVTVG